MYAVKCPAALTRLCLLLRFSLMHLGTTYIPKSQGFDYIFYRSIYLSNSLTYDKLKKIVNFLLKFVNEYAIISKESLNTVL